MNDDHSLLLGFYGDDFTGSTDVMEALTRSGLRTVCFVKIPTPEMMREFHGARAVGVAGLSRSMTPERMEEELHPVFQALRELRAPIVHYKTCSTFDSSPQIGSIGKAIDIGSEVFGSPYVPVVVGAPILGRYCVFGNLFARSGLDTEPFRLDRHPTMSRHPITPMDESDLRLHLARQTKKSSALFDVLKLAQPMEAAEESFRTLLESEPEVVLFDTLSDDHLPMIGRLISQQATVEQPLFTAGSSGTEYALAAWWREQGLCEKRSFDDPGEVDPLLVLSGSCSPVSAGQIEYSLAQGWREIALQTERLLEQDEMLQECETAAQQALHLLEQGYSVIVHTACGPEDARIQGTVQRLKKKGYSDLDCKLLSGKFFGDALGQILTLVLERKRLRRAAVAGGDTSGYLARYVGIEAMEMVGPMAPGSPLCRVYKPGSPLHHMEITFKGGQVGKKDFYQIAKRGLPI